MDVRSSVTASDPGTRRGPRLPAPALARAATVPAYAVCATYTLIAPPLAALGLIGPALFLHEALAFVAPLNLLVLRLGFSQHRHARPLQLATAGVVLILLHMLGHIVLGTFADPALALDTAHPLEVLLPILVAIGGALLAAGVVTDWRLQRRSAYLGTDGPSAAEHWRAILTGVHPDLRRGRHLFGLLPSSERCKLCHAPFRGPFAPLMRLIGKRPSDKSPLLCGECLSKTQLGGVELEVSLLFADVRGSTTIAEHVSASEYSRLLNRFYAVSSDVLVRTDALIDKLVGDEVIGLYLPGFAGPLHARRALEAARALLRATGHADPAGPWLPIGIGVHTGTAFVGAVGSEGGAKDITALGDAVNIAARLTGAAAPGEILVSEAACSAAGVKIEGLERRTLALKGRTEPVDVRVLHVAGRPLRVPGRREYRTR